MTIVGVQRQMEQNIARCRLILSIAAIVAVYVDPAPPLLSHWIPLVSGPFVMDFRLLLVMLLHLAYSGTVYALLWREWTPPGRVALPTIALDLLFGTAIGTLTEGPTSPAFAFFAFAVLAAGLRGGMRPAMAVTAASVGLYECLLVLSTRGGADVYIMRPVYLAIAGYLVGYLGQQRLDLQEEMHELEVAEQRHRIGRDLHDNFAQALAGITLKLEDCRRQLQADPGAPLLADLTELQQSVRREFDDLRLYSRSLAGLEVKPAGNDDGAATQLSLSAQLSGSLDFVDHILQITREGINNVRRHARATNARIEIRSDASQVHVSIADDGVGIRGEASPWSIASRVKQIGGQIQIMADEGRGTHLMITVPQV